MVWILTITLVLSWIKLIALDTRLKKLEKQQQNLQNQIKHADKPWETAKKATQKPTATPAKAPLLPPPPLPPQAPMPRVAPALALQSLNLSTEKVANSFNTTANKTQKTTTTNTHGVATNQNKSAEKPTKQAPQLPTWLSFESLMGGKGFVVIGALALILATAFFLRHAVINDWFNWLTIAMRCTAAAIFGVGLCGIAQWAYSRNNALAQALSGTGIVVLYGSLIAAHNFDLLPHITLTLSLCFAISGAAILLALRHGQMTAVIGLLGGMGMPLLLLDEASTTQVTVYMAILALGSMTLAQIKSWMKWAWAIGVLGLLWQLYIALTQQSPMDLLLLAAWGLVQFGMIAARANKSRAALLMARGIMASCSVPIVIGALHLGISPASTMIICCTALALIVVCYFRRKLIVTLPLAALLLVIQALATWHSLSILSTNEILAQKAYMEWMIASGLILAVFGAGCYILALVNAGKHCLQSLLCSALAQFMSLFIVAAGYYICKEQGLEQSHNAWLAIAFFVWHTSSHYFCWRKWQLPNRCRQTIRDTINICKESCFTVCILLLILAGVAIIPTNLSTIALATLACASVHAGRRLAVKSGTVWCYIMIINCTFVSLGHLFDSDSVDGEWQKWLMHGLIPLILWILASWHRPQSAFKHCLHSPTPQRVFTWIGTCLLALLAWNRLNTHSLTELYYILEKPYCAMGIPFIYFGMAVASGFWRKLRKGNRLAIDHNFTQLFGLAGLLSLTITHGMLHNPWSGTFPKEMPIIGVYGTILLPMAVLISWAYLMRSNILDWLASVCRICFACGVVILTFAILRRVDSQTHVFENPLGLWEISGTTLAFALISIAWLRMPRLFMGPGKRIVAYGFTGLATIYWILTALIGRQPLISDIEINFLQLIVTYGSVTTLCLVLPEYRKTPTAIKHLCQASGIALLCLCATLCIRMAFHGNNISLAQHAIHAQESMTLSIVWGFMGCGMVAAAIKLKWASLRIGSLCVILLTTAKVFFVDLSSLTGMPRILSFFVLGLIMMALGYIYPRFVFDKKVPSTDLPEDQPQA